MALTEVSDLRFELVLKVSPPEGRGRVLCLTHSKLRERSRRKRTLLSFQGPNASGQET